MFVDGSGPNEQSIERTFHRCFTSFGWAVSEENIKMWKVNGPQTTDAKWWQQLTLPLARWAKNPLSFEIWIFRISHTSFIINAACLAKYKTDIDRKSKSKVKNKCCTLKFYVCNAWIHIFLHYYNARIIFYEIKQNIVKPDQCGHIYLADICIKRSPFPCSIIECFIRIESLFRGHLSKKTIFSLS
jgi:hypothetical protein